MTHEELEQGALQAQGKAAYEDFLKNLCDVEDVLEFAAEWGEIPPNIQQEWIALVNKSAEAYQQYYLDHGDEVQE
jgi:hypothetical protein